jgi:enediyne polyketide synthase
MRPAIAIVGMACVFPDANGPRELWENVLAQRSAFRRMPQQRLSSDYLSPDPQALDQCYCEHAALIDGYVFDRLKYRVSGAAYRSTDLVHWLALDVASRALQDAKFADGEGLPKETTGVLVGNTLTGEFSRAQLMRLRWPYVRAVVEQQLQQSGLAAAERRQFLEMLEARYKAPFAAMSEETLAGGLSNTIAGRICNQFDLGGGGYVVDGACSSSLLAVANACRALSAHELDVAVVGGVDLSLDPFELVGFARLGALAKEEMRVYDAHASGFLPGEGCGFVVLMREEDARTSRKDIYAAIRGCGISSDGSGGLTRPEVAGQGRALQRAYRSAGFGIHSVCLFEGHGTGTAIGDAVELTAIAQARAGGGAPPSRAAIGSIKANIGHTKAAAGIAGLIKAALAIQAQIQPPTTGVTSRHPLFASEAAAALEVLSSPRAWPKNEPLRAGVSAFGFGGINTHVVIEGADAASRNGLTSFERRLARSRQDAELFLLSAGSIEALRAFIEKLLTIARGLAAAELADLAAELGRRTDERTVRAAIVAATPQQLDARLKQLRDWLDSGATQRLDIQHRIFLGCGSAAPRILFLFPGQGSRPRLDGGALPRRFAVAAEIYAQLDWLPCEAEGESADAALATDVAQPAIVAAQLAALRVLQRCGVRPDAVLGHSLGELTALCCAGAFDDAELLALARCRGAAMAAVPGPAGAMASIGAAAGVAAEIIESCPGVQVAAVNSPRQTVVAGEREAVDRAIRSARARSIPAARLAVSHAFHSPLMLPAADALAEYLRNRVLAPLRATVFSTVTGGRLAPKVDLRAILVRQLTSPVLFSEALHSAAGDADLGIEIGPGKVLGELSASISSLPIVSTNAGSASLDGVLAACAAVFALGGKLDARALFADRFTRAFSVDRSPLFFASPCAQEPARLDAAAEPPPGNSAAAASMPVHETGASAEHGSVLDVLREVVAARAEIPADVVRGETRLLADLHLNSITVGQIVADVARRFGLAAPVAPTELAHATVSQIAETLAGLARTRGNAGAAQGLPAGIDDWIEPFEIQWLQSDPGVPRNVHENVGHWQLLTTEDGAIAQRLQQALSAAGGEGVAVYAPCDADELQVATLLLRAAQISLQREDSERCLLLIQQDTCAASFLRCAHLESRNLTTCVVDAPADERLIERVLAELAVASGYHEVRYAGDRRLQPALRHAPLARRSLPVPLTPEDLLLVTGGGKGIAAECALALAQRTGVRLLLLGRSEPAFDRELRANLDRLQAKAVVFEYLSVDVMDADAVRTRLAEAVGRLGRVTAILHGAGNNSPQPVRSLSESMIRSTCAPKIAGLRNVLAALDTESLRLLVSFGSIIARTGLRGEAHYGFANEWLARTTERFAAAHPRCRCLTLEWSIWSDVGMGERLGSVEALAREGISAIAPDGGIEALLAVLAGDYRGSLVVAGRIPDLPTLRIDRPALPLLRFIETPRVYFPGIELIADARISDATDLYLDDHRLGAERLLPAVLGLEAMAQCARAVAATQAAPIFEAAEFVRPIVIAAGATLTVRAIAQARSDGNVAVALRASSSGFAVDHFRAQCRFVHDLAPLAKAVAMPAAAAAVAALDCADGLYDSLLFHRGRFRRVVSYQHLQPRSCRFTVRAGGDARWFGAFLPEQLLLSDPGARDGALHGIQACVPHERLLPVAVDTIVPATSELPGTLIVAAVERRHEGRTYVYDVDICSSDGELLETWRGLQLRSVGRIEHKQWHPALFRVYLQRRLETLLGNAAIKMSFELGDRQQRTRSEAAVTELFGRPKQLLRRGDGKPELRDDPHRLSIAHAGELTFAVASLGAVACDLEAVVSRTDHQWSDLLGPQQSELTSAIAQQVGEPASTAATRIWTARECLKKSGLQFDAPLAVRCAEEDGWVVLGSGDRRIATQIAAVDGKEGSFALAVLGGGDHAGL